MELKFTAEEMDKILDLAEIHSGIEWNRNNKEMARIVAHTEIMFIVRTFRQELGLEPYDFDEYDEFYEFDEAKETE